MSRTRSMVASTLAGFAAGALAGVAITNAVIGAPLSRSRRDLSTAQHALAHDPLTGLPNRRAFLNHLDAALERGAAVAVAMLDLDRFKPSTTSSATAPVTNCCARSPTGYAACPQRCGWPPDYKATSSCCSSTAPTPPLSRARPGMPSPPPRTWWPAAITSPSAPASAWPSRNPPPGQTRVRTLTTVACSTTPTSRCTAPRPPVRAWSSPTGTPHEPAKTGEPARNGKAARRPTRHRLRATGNSGPPSLSTSRGRDQTGRAAGETPTTQPRAPQATSAAGSLQPRP